MAETAQARQRTDRPGIGSRAVGAKAVGARAAAPKPADTGVPGAIDGAYLVDLARKLPVAGGGRPAFAVQDLKAARGNLMAVPARRGAPPRARVLAALQGATLTGVASPVAHGIAPGPDGVAEYFVVCTAAPGTPLGNATTIGRVWNEAELLACVLRPVAAGLAELAALGVTHRGVRPDNLFQATAGQKVTLGEAWSAPPASLQPAVFEPPYVGICPPAARGDGSIADDVYALGVVLVALATGVVPLADLDEAEIVRRKLAQGSFAALAGERYLPPAIADLVRGMLAEDPDHRPSPLQLDDPDTARSRRLAIRPVRTALRALELPGASITTARVLAGVLATSPATAPALLRGGQIDPWLRRSLGDATAAARIDESVRLRAESPGEDAAADAMLVARAITILDPLMPLCWRSVPFWPDGLGPALAAATAGQLVELRQAIATEAIATWATMRPERCEPAVLRVESRQHRAILLRRGWMGGIAVLRYMLNPLCHCPSRMLGRQLVVRTIDLLPALEQEAARPERPAGWPVDAEIAALVVARQDFRLERELAVLADPRTAEAADPGVVALAHVQVLAQVQDRVQGAPVPTLATALAAAMRPAFTVWQRRSRRAELEALLEERSKIGKLAGLLDLLDNRGLRQQDQQEAADARYTLARIDATLDALRTERDRHIDAARRVGQEAAAAVGVIAASAVALWLAL